MKVLVTGAAGYIGKFICSYLKNEYDVISTDCKRPQDSSGEFELLDITDENRVKKQLDLLKPDVVIHLAGIKDLNFSQKNKDTAYNINVRGTDNIINACKNTGARLVFLSTDYVFDGQKGMYKEEDAVNPQTYYGATKIEAEKLIKQKLQNYVIIRTGGVFGGYDNVTSPLFAWLLYNLKANKPVDAFVDVYNSPTPLDVLGDGMIRVLEIADTGIFHVAGPERINRFDFFKKIATHSGFNAGLIRPINNKDSDQLFLRPKDISLDTGKMRACLGIK